MIKLFPFPILKKISRSLLVGSLSLAGLVILASQLPIPGGFHWYSVVTGSMSPTLPVGSLLIVRQPVKPATLPIGTIITFSQPGNAPVLITHRIYDIRQGTNLSYFVTKGDASPTPDTWLVRPEQIKGVYLTHVPYLGYGLEFMKSPVGIVMFIILPTLILAGVEIQTIINLKVHQQVSTLTNQHLPVVILLVFVSSVAWTSRTWALFSSNTVTLGHNQVRTAGATTTPPPAPTSTCPPLYVNISQENSHTGPGSTNTNSVNITNTCQINIKNTVY